MFTGASNAESCGSEKEIVSVMLPSVSSIEGFQDNDSEKNYSKFAHHSYTQHSNHQIPNLVTLSLLPKSQWQSLINLDSIKVLPAPI
ncbi:hypothetical protein U1Q18_014087 [Sarracenia purpurea var. burkii]